MEVSWKGMREMLARVTRIEEELKTKGTLKRMIGQKLVKQTKYRITDEKRSPDGERWALWSTEYAKTRTAEKSLLRDTDALLNSIKATVRGSADNALVAVHSDLPYAGRQQDARPYMGLSTANVDELEILVNDWLDRL